MSRQNKFSSKRLRKLWILFGRECSYCWKPILLSETTRDHVRSKAEGGSDDPINIVPACRPCNRQKGSQNVVLFLRDHGFDEKSILERIRFRNIIRADRMERIARRALERTK